MARNASLVKGQANYRGGARILARKEKHRTKFHTLIPLKSCTAMASPKFWFGRDIQQKYTNQRPLKILKNLLKQFAQKFKNSPKFKKINEI